MTHCESTYSRRLILSQHIVREGQTRGRLGRQELLWHPIYFFSFLYLTRCITTAVTWLTTLPSPICFCLPMTHSDSVLIRCCNSVLVLWLRWLVMTHYYTLTHYESSTVQWLTMSRVTYCSSDPLSKWHYCPCDAYCGRDSIVLNYYKYRRLWSLRPQTWLLVSYGTTANTPHLSLHIALSLICSKYSS